MINTQSELIRLVTYMHTKMPSSLWFGIKLEGGKKIVAFCEN